MSIKEDAQYLLLNVITSCLRQNYGAIITTHHIYTFTGMIVSKLDSSIHRQHVCPKLYRVITVWNSSKDLNDKLGLNDVLFRHWGQNISLLFENLSTTLLST